MTTSYGYKIFVLRVTQPRHSTNISFDNPGWGEGGARSVLHAALTDIARGHDDDRKQTYTEIGQVSGSNWGVLLHCSGGAYGEPAAIADRRSGQRADYELSSDDVVLADARVLFLVPPYGEYGLVVSESRGRSHLTAGVINALNKRLRADGAYVRLDRESADDVAWQAFLDRDEVDVSSVELVQYRRPADDGRITEDDVLTKARLILDLAEDAGARGRVAHAIHALRDQPGRLQVASLVGLRDYGDDDFDEEILVVVADGKDRRLNVTHGWPSFVYDTGEDKLGDSQFLAEARSAARDTLHQMDVDLPASGWWPSA